MYGAMYVEELLAAVKKLAAGRQLSDVMQATTETELVYRWGCNNFDRSGRVHVVAVGKALLTEQDEDATKKCAQSLKLQRLILIHYHSPGVQSKLEFTADGEYTVECDRHSPSLWKLIAGLQLECKLTTSLQ